MVVEGKVIDLAEVGAGTDDIGAIFEETCAERLDELVDGSIVITGSYSCIKRLRY